jgi:hypothetical protein
MLAFALLVGLLPPSQVTFSRAAAAQLAPAAAPGQQAPVATAAAGWTLDEILAALRHVESGGCPDEGRSARGDGGSAIGPYQIHRAYWQDAKVPGSYERCRDAEYARAVVLAYWRRYCPQALQALEAETLVRVHNGGPRGHAKASTRAFWLRVERELWRQRAPRG